MKESLLILSLCFCFGCASVGTHQKWVDGKWVNDERYVCRGAGCEVDFKNQTMKGGTLIPTLPTIKVNQ